MQHLTGDLLTKKCPYTEIMDIYQTSLANFRLAVEIFGTRKALSERVGLSPNLLNQYIGKNPIKRIGDEVARRLDSALKASEGFVDIPRSIEEMRTGVVATNTARAYSDECKQIGYTVIQIIGTIMPNSLEMLGSISISKSPTALEYVPVLFADSNTRAYKVAKQGFGDAIRSGWIIAFSPILTPGHGDLLLINPDSEFPVFGEYLYSSGGEMILELIGGLGRVNSSMQADFYRVIAFLPPHVVIKEK